MSDAPRTRPQIPEGKSRYLTTRQKQANEKGYVGYETIWEAFQKEVKYTTPKRPLTPGAARPVQRARGRIF